jgi:hypothetical protein
MKRFLSRRPSPAFVISLIALFIALGGTSYAALSLPKNSVGTKQLKNGAVTRAKVASGLVPTVMWAVVNSTGNVVRSSGGVTGSSISTGRYDIEFPRNVTACVYSATVGDTAAGSAIGQIGEASRSNHVNGVYVETNDTTGAISAEPFHLVVVC